MCRRILFMMFAGLFLLGSLNSVLAAPPQKGSRQKEVKPQIDVIPKPAGEVRLTDNPWIRVFEIDPPVLNQVLREQMTTFKWRVEPGTGGSLISGIRVTRVTVLPGEIFRSSNASGEQRYLHPLERYTLAGCNLGDEIEFVLHATNQLGRTASRRFKVTIGSSIHEEAELSPLPQPRRDHHIKPEPVLPYEALPPPRITSVTPNRGRPGYTLDVTIRGSNFYETSAVNFGDGIIVNRFTEITLPNPEFNRGGSTIPYLSDEIQANISISPTAKLGYRSVFVTTPYGSCGEKSLFNVRE